MTPTPIPERLQRLIDERVVEAIPLDSHAIAMVWTKAVNSEMDAREEMLSVDNRVGLAYQAGLQATHAYLAAHGYRVKSARSHHYYSFYAAQALAELDKNPALKESAEEIDGCRTRRANAVYDPDPATDDDLKEILQILAKLMPAVHAALIRINDVKANSLPTPGKRVTPGGKPNRG